MLTPFSRERKVDYSEYVRHLIKHESGRFASHPRFRFLAFNTIMRRQASKKSGFYVRRRHRQAEAELDPRELLDLIQSDTPEADALIRSIAAFGSSLRGTRPYWFSQRREPQAMVKGLGAGHIFLTQSAADLHWPDLMRHLPRYQEWVQADANQRARIARENLRDNPHIAAYWFDFRWRTFLNTVLKEKLNVSDYWSRYEWQDRGSTHAHSILWVESAPDGDRLLTSELRGAPSMRSSAMCTVWCVDPPDQLLINLDGKAGTGKSHVIGVIYSVLQDLTNEAGITTTPILRAAPTGVAAHAIAGFTLHRLFRLPVPLTAGYQELPATTVRDLQELFAGVRYLIIDEKSFDGRRIPKESLILHFLDNQRKYRKSGSTDSRY
ncbi:uncharacterized protein N7515_001284 [Penicillium bovifimosum]|uniref:ATP-dependent DNA helicase n=1 Tax=Penicillium bovifimosum TaxID=126998 RepID=A0A9W9H9E3_9EURO|nr:uncharacterized protein N7515_001284 [Penicillium bovifimosum]KAJ5142497.1 hypothetical protein N7515_001284 [Penicillium bovifimosum]